MQGAPTVGARRLLENAGWLATGEGLSRVLGLAIALYLARTLGAEGYGMVGVAAALLGFLRILVHMGTGPIGLREVARSPAALPSVYARISGLRLAIAALCILLVVVASPALGRALAVPAIVLVVYALHLLPQTITPMWAYRGLERMRPIGVARVAEGLLVLAGLTLLVRGPDTQLAVVPLVQLLALSAVTLWLWARLRRTHGPLRVGLDFRRWPPLLGEGTLIGLSTLLDTVYVDGDALLLGLLTGPATAAEFLVSHRVVLALLLGSLILQQAAFPATSRLVATAPDRAIALQAALLRYAVVLLAPVIVLLAWFADVFIVLLFGEPYAGAADVLRISLLSLPFTAAGQGLGRLLISAGAPRSLLFGRLVGVAVHVGIALALIPAWSARGAAVACVLGEVAGAIALGVLCSAALGAAPLDRRTLAPAVAAALAAATLWLADGFGPAAQVAGGAAVYAASVLLLGGIDLRELRELRATLRAERP